MADQENKTGVIEQAVKVSRDYIVNQSNQSMANLLDLAERRTGYTLEEAKGVCQDFNLWVVFLNGRVCLNELYQVKEVEGELRVREGNGEWLK